MVIFQSTDRGATKVFDNEGLIMTFERQNLNLIKNASGELMRTNESDAWISVLEDETLIERAKKHPGFNVEFKIVESIPTKHGNASIVKSQQNIDVDGIKEKSKRYGFLQASIVLKDGSYAKSATPELIEEFETLKKELEG
jgi:hypothetical protein